MGIYKILKSILLYIKKRLFVIPYSFLSLLYLLPFTFLNPPSASSWFSLFPSSFYFFCGVKHPQLSEANWELEFEYFIWYWDVNFSIYLSWVFASGSWVVRKSSGKESWRMGRCIWRWGRKGWGSRGEETVKRCEMRDIFFNLKYLIIIY